MDEQMLVVTSDNIPGYDIVEVYGEVFGLLTRSRNMVSNIGAGLKTIIGGEIGAYTKMLTDSRTEAVERMKQAAYEKGANAIVCMRFDTSELGGTISEVAAYGTAVKVSKKQ